MNQAPLGGFYTTAGGSTIGGGTTVVVGQHSHSPQGGGTVVVDGNVVGGGHPQSREFSPHQQQLNSLPQNFVVVSQQQVGTCACTNNGYAMNCDSPNCVNKFHLTPPHLAHNSQQQQQQQSSSQQQQQQITTTSNNQIITYSMSSQVSQVNNNNNNNNNSMPVELLHENVHELETVEMKPQMPPIVDEKELRRQRLAEMARLRYQNLSQEEKKAVNSRRMLLRKRKRQREREMEELETILRQSNDIEEDVVFIGDLREKRQRENRAKAARSRYQNMSLEERRNYNQKRRLRQMAGVVGGVGGGGAGGGGDAPAGSTIDPNEQEQIKQQIAQQNARKAELARQRYHRMSVEERKLYNKRRTESLRRRRLEEEALLATPAGQIDAESLHKAQQIMIRNAIRAEKARQRYKRKAPEERERKPPTSSGGGGGRGRAKKPTGGIGDLLMNNSYNIRVNSEGGGGGIVGGSPNENNCQIKRDIEEGDILSAIERDVIRRTQEAKHVLEQRSSTGSNGPLTIIGGGGGPPQQLPSTSSLLSSPLGGQMTFKREPSQQLMEQQQQQQPPQQQQQLINVCQMPLNNNLPPGAQFATIQQGLGGHNPQQQINLGGPIIGQDLKTGLTTKYVSYMQLPAGTTQSGFLLADGQFVALQHQEPIQGYTVDQHSNNFDNNNFHQLNPAVATTTVLRANNNNNNNPSIVAGGGVPGVVPQQIIIGGQRVEIIPAGNLSGISGNGVVTDSAGGAIQYHQVLNYQQQPPPPLQQQQPQYSQQQQIGQQQLQQQQQQIITQQPPPPQQQQQQQQQIVVKQHSNRGRNSHQQQSDEILDEKTLSQKAKRAERARRRYHEMSAEQRHEFNAKRAMALKMARLKDDELCRMGDEYELTGGEMSDELRHDIQQARIRRSKRAESARQKYQKMTPEQRKAHNAMRDAQRRQRKREMEENNKNSEEIGIQQQQHGVDDGQHDSNL